MSAASGEVVDGVVAGVQAGAVTRCLEGLAVALAVGIAACTDPVITGPPKIRSSASHLTFPDQQRCSTS